MPMRSSPMSACPLLLLAWACGPQAGPGMDDAPGDETTATSSSATTTGGLDATSSGGSVDATTVPATTTADATTEPSDTTADDTTGGPIRVDPTHLLIIRMPHGVFEEHVWTGSGEGFVLGPVLEPLAPWSDALVLIDGVDNEIVDPETGAPTNAYGLLSASILTGGLFGSAVDWGGMPFYYGGGPSLDVVLGGELGRATPIGHVHLGVEATDPGIPLGVSYVAADEPFPPIDDPVLAYEALFGGLSDPLLDELASDLSPPPETPGQVLEAQLAIAHAAIALDVSRVQLLSIDLGLPNIRWTELGVFDDYHSVIASADPEPVRIIQTFWAERIAALLERLEATPAEGGGSLLERTVIVWMSAEGSPPPGYPTEDVFAMIIDASGTFATGGIVDVEADQADFAVTIAAAMGVPLEAFGNPELEATVIEDLLAR